MVAINKTLDKAQKYVAKGYLDKAIDEYRKVLEAKPGDESTRLRVGDLYVKVGKDEDAIKAYHEVGRSLTKKGFYLKAIAVFKQILKLDPTNIDIRYRLAELYTKQGLVADAIGEYDILAKHFESKAKREDALNIIKKMIEIDPENVGIRLRLAEIYDQSGFHEDAFAEYSDASARLVKNGKHDKAEKVLRTLYDNDKKHPMVLEGLIGIAQAKGENDLFLNYSRELISLYDELGDAGKRQEAQERLLEVMPGESGATEVVERAVEEVAEADEGIIEEEAVAEEEVEALQEEIVPEPEEEHPGEPEGDDELTPWTDLVEIEEDTVPSLDETDEGLEVVEETAEVGDGEPEASAEGMDEEGEDADETLETGLEEPEEDSVSDLEGGGLEEEVLEPIAELSPTDIEELPELEAEPLDEVIEEVSEYSEVVDEVGDDEAAVEEERVVAVDETTAEEAGDGEDEALDESGSGFFDLSSELGLDADQDGFMWLDGIEAHAEMNEEFKDGIERQLNKEDSETHYNMGIAFMEMEMHEEAIKEFNVAIKDPQWEFDCQIRLGLSYMEMGEHRKAIACYAGGLAVKGRTESELKGIMYELALAYEADGQGKRAQEIYKKVSNIDSNFRDVAVKIGGVKKVSRPLPTDDEVIEVELI